MAYPGGYDPKRIGSGGMYGGSTPRSNQPNAKSKYDRYVGGYDPSKLKGTVAQRSGTMYSAGDPVAVAAYNRMRDQNQNPNPNPNLGGGGGGGRGGGGGGAGVPNFAGIIDLLNRKPQQQSWENMTHRDYVPPAFRDFDSSIYDRARTGLTDAIAADRQSGNAAYDEGMAALQDYINPFLGGPQTTNPQQSAAMRRMFEANAVPRNFNQDETERGVQADQAFGNVLSLLGVVADQGQNSRVRAMQGDQRRFGETLDAEQRGGNLATDLREAEARRIYDQEKWQFGEEVARMNYNTRLGIDQYNNQGRNATSQANVQGNNSWNQGNIQSIINMIASGGTGVDPSAYRGV
jgi:hypothetical protein